MEKIKQPNLDKLKSKINNLSNAQYKKIIKLLDSINLNINTPSQDINKKLINQVKETLKINNDDFKMLIKIYRLKLIEKEKNEI